MHKPPYQITLKPYGQALLELARKRPEIVCLGADLTRQTETDIFRDAIPERFINVGMAEANMMGIAGGLARAGHLVFVNTFGVFCTRRCFDQVAMSIAYPRLNVKIVGFMPGLSSPGGPSHQAIDDVALMRALPNMTVVEPADAVEVRQAVAAIADRPGPVYMRLKRGETPVIFDDDHRLDMDKARVLTGKDHGEVCIIAAGMMIPAALAAAQVLESRGAGAVVLNVPVIKPLDAATVVGAAQRSRLVITAENHNIIGGLGSAVAEALAEAGTGRASAADWHRRRVWRIRQPRISFPPLRPEHAEHSRSGLARVGAGRARAYGASGGERPGSLRPGLSSCIFAKMKLSSGKKGRTHVFYSHSRV